VIAAALLTLTVGFCAVHCAYGAVHNHGMPLMVCSGAPASLLVLTLLAGPLVTRYSPFDPFRSVYAVSLALLDPPPKALSLA
jgi:hypothetical protein